MDILLDAASDTMKAAGQQLNALNSESDRYKNIRQMLQQILKNEKARKQKKEIII